MDIIGREREKGILTRCEQSNRPEFVAVYGRRRIGKTFLITEHFNNRFSFFATGISNAGKNIQLEEFRRALMKYYQGEVAEFKSWYDAFSALEEKICGDLKLEKKILFIDELPWFDTVKNNKKNMNS